jgi:N-acetylmuramoyl-L-alanine amidase
MRDTIMAQRGMAQRGIARRAFCGLAAGAAAAALGCGPLRAAQSPAQRKPPPSQSKPAPRPKPPPRHILAIDPGHGGVDPGAISPHGLFEKDITLSAARELARQLDATGRFRVVLTRSSDTFVPLRQRVARARLVHAELFLSIHADALPDSDMRGLSVYTLSDQASDRETAALAIRENKDDFVGGIRLSRQRRDIAPILLDMARRQTNNGSLALAHTIVAELGRAVPLLDKPHRSAGFAVLTAPDIPSALVELGCLSNPAEERLLPQRAYQQRLARGLLRAIEDYFAAHAVR